MQLKLIFLIAKENYTFLTKFSEVLYLVFTNQLIYLYSWSFCLVPAGYGASTLPSLNIRVICLIMQDIVV